MIKYKFLFVLVLLISGTLSAQKNRALLGQKNILEANYAVNMTLMSDKLYYEREGSTLVQKKLGLQHGFQFSYVRNLVGKLSIGVEFDYAKYIYAPGQIYVSIGEYYSQAPYDVEKIDVNYKAFIGKFEFGRREGIFPIGVSHQIGGGLLIVSPKENSGSLYASSQYSNVKPFEFDYKLGSTKGFTAFYNLNFRAPLSDRLMLNFGFRYNYSRLFRVSNENDGNYISEGDMVGNVNDIISWNFIRLYTGLAFSF